MDISRRKFVRTGVIASALAAIPLASAKNAAARDNGKTLPQSLIAGANGGAEVQSSALDFYSKSRFTPYLNSQFQVKSSQLETVKVTLTEVTDFCETASTGGECFALRFTGPARGSFQQNTYEVEHAALGKFSLFLVPAGVRRDGAKAVNYEAVINRRH
jgi:hypothetical protein